MKNQKEIIEAAIAEIKERTMNNGEINYAYVSGYLQGLLETAALIGFDRAIENLGITIGEKK